MIPRFMAAGVRVVTMGFALPFSVHTTFKEAPLAEYESALLVEGISSANVSFARFNVPLVVAPPGEAATRSHKPVRSLEPAPLLDPEPPELPPEPLPLEPELLPPSPLSPSGTELEQASSAQQAATVSHRRLIVHLGL
jgi:hypothetical protein